MGEFGLPGELAMLARVMILPQKPGKSEEMLDLT